MLSIFLPLTPQSLKHTSRQGVLVSLPIERFPLVGCRQEQGTVQQPWHRAQGGRCVSPVFVSTW